MSHRFYRRWTRLLAARCLLLVTVCLLMLPTTAVEAANPRIERYQQRIEQAIKARNGAEAMKLAKEMIERNAEDPDAWILHAKLMMMSRNAQQAISDLNKALELEPHHPTASATMAGLEFQQGKQEAGIKRVDEALEKHPNAPALLQFKAQVAGSRNDWPAAIEAYEKILAHDHQARQLQPQEKAGILAQLAQAAQQAQLHHKAGNAFLAAAQLADHHPQMYQQAIQSFEQAEEYEAALQVIDTAIPAMKEHKQLNQQMRDGAVKQLEAMRERIAEKLPSAKYGEDFEKIRKNIRSGLWSHSSFYNEEKMPSEDVGLAFFGMTDEDANPITAAHWKVIREELKKKAESREPTLLDKAVEQLYDNPASEEARQAVAQAAQKSAVAVKQIRRERMEERKANGADVDIESAMEEAMRYGWSSLTSKWVFTYRPMFPYRQNFLLKEKRWQDAFSQLQDQTDSKQREQLLEELEWAKLEKQIRQDIAVFPEALDYQQLVRAKLAQKDFGEAAQLAWVGLGLAAYEKAHKYRRGSSSTGETLAAYEQVATQNLRGNATEVDQNLWQFLEALKEERWLDAAELAVVIRQYKDSDPDLSFTEWASKKTAGDLFTSLYSDHHEAMLDAVIAEATRRKQTGDLEGYRELGGKVGAGLLMYSHVPALLYQLQFKHDQGELEGKDPMWYRLFTQDPDNREGHKLRAQVYEQEEDYGKALLHYAAAIEGALIPNKQKGITEQDVAEFKAFAGKHYPSKKELYAALVENINQVLKNWSVKDAGVVNGVTSMMAFLGGDPVNLFEIRLAARKMIGDAAGAAADAMSLSMKKPEKAGQYWEAAGDAAKDVPQMAIFAYDRAIQKSDAPAGILYAKRGEAYAEAEMYAKALPDLNKAIEMDAADGQVYMLRSEVLEALGEIDAAGDDALAAMRLYKEADQNWRVSQAAHRARRLSHLQLKQSEQKLKESMGRFQKIAEENPEAIKELNAAVEKARQQQKQHGATTQPATTQPAATQPSKKKTPIKP